MSGMYGMLFGQNPGSDVILATLGLTERDVGRFRDCGVADGKIYVYTRNGGGNREHYDYKDPPVPEGPECDCTGCTIQYRLPEHPFYVRDEDDEFDCTYATVWFSFPPEYAEGLASLDSGDAWDPDGRWLAMIDAIGGKP